MMPTADRSVKHSFFVILLSSLIGLINNLPSRLWNAVVYGTQCDRQFNCVQRMMSFSLVKKLLELNCVPFRIKRPSYASSKEKHTRLPFVIEMKFIYGHWALYAFFL